MPSIADAAREISATTATSPDDAMGLARLAYRDCTSITQADSDALKAIVVAAAGQNRHPTDLILPGHIPRQAG